MKSKTKARKTKARKTKTRKTKTRKTKNRNTKTRKTKTRKTKTRKTKTRKTKTRKTKKKAGMFKGLQGFLSEGVPQVVQSISEGLPSTMREAKREFDRERYGGLDAAQKKELEDLYKYFIKKYEVNYPEGKQLDGKRLLKKRLDKREIKNLRNRLNKEIGSKESSEVYVAGIEGNVRKLKGDQLYKAIPPVKESRLRSNVKPVRKKKKMYWSEAFPSRSSSSEKKRDFDFEPYQKANSANSEEWEMSLG